MVKQKSAIANRSPIGGKGDSRRGLTDFLDIANKTIPNDRVEFQLPSLGGVGEAFG